MASATLCLRTGRGIQGFNKFGVLHRVRKLLYCTEKSVENESEKKVTGFSASFDAQSKMIKEVPDSFSTLLRKSKFIDLGDPDGKVVIGTIYHVMGNDLYIDFGWKFPTVCTKPQVNSNLYHKGAKVRLLVKDLELSTRFLGSTNDISLLEADCLLLGLAFSNTDEM